MCDAVEEIAAALRDAASEPDLTGDGGLALLFGQLALERNEAYGETCLAHLQRLLERAAEAEGSASLFTGLPGVLWVAGHLGRIGVVDLGEEDLGAAADESLLEALGRGDWDGDYDLISGLTGIGFYFVERLPRALASEGMRRVLEQLERRAERHGAGCTWHTDPALLPDSNRQLTPHGHYNLGVAHGVPAVIAVLARCCAAGIETERARCLLDGAVAWLLEQRLPAGVGSCFAAYTGPGIEPKPSRLAWCYGDLGIAATLHLAGCLVGEPRWQREALDIARTAAGRPVDSSRVADAGLCHGAAGVAHLFNRLYQTSGDAELRQAACFWLDRTLALRRPDQGLAGFLGYKPDTNLDSRGLRWVPETGFLTGAAGVGLALLAATSAVEPAWDRVLLISAPAAPPISRPTFR